MRNMESYYVALELIEKGRFSEALEMLEKLKEINPGNSYIEFNIAKIKARNKRTLAESREIFKRILAGDNKLLSASLLELGKLEVLERNYDKARSYFNKLIKRENSVLAYFELAKLEVKLRNFDEARRYLQIIIDREDKFYELALMELGKIEKKLGNINKAIDYFGQISPDSPHINQNWVKFELAKIALITDNFDRGIQMLIELLHTNISTEALVDIIRAYIRIEKYDLAYQYNIELQKRSDAKSRVNAKQIDVFLKYKMGILEIDLNEATYFTNQLVNYNKEEAIKHIEKHLDEEDEKEVHSLYSEDIDINELYEFIQEKIKDMEPCSGFLNEKYIVRCNKVIGTAIDKLTDTVQVITIPNTKDIITIYPFPAMNGELVIEEQVSKQKVKESQIAKFNRRYVKK